MFLKRFRERFIQNNTKKLLALPQEDVRTSKVKTIGVLLNADEFSDYEGFKTYFKTLGLQSHNYKFLAFSATENLEHPQWDMYFYPKDISWRGQIKNPDVDAFIQEKFDVLIAYFTEDSPELDLITAISKANLKVGLSPCKQDFYHLAIAVDIEEIDLFKQELKKYLTVLNKL